VLLQYQTGGTVTPAKPQGPIGPQGGDGTPGTEEAQRQWLLNWHRNRKVDDPYLNNLIEEERPARLKRVKEKVTFKYGKGSELIPVPEGEEVDPVEDNNLFGVYLDEEKGQPIGINENLTQLLKEQTVLHELNHRVDDFPRRTATWEKVFMDRVLPKGVPGEKSDDTFWRLYMSDPGEVKSRLMELRKTAGFKPDKDVTDEELKKVLSEVEGGTVDGFDQLMDFIYSDLDATKKDSKDKARKRLLLLLNNTVSNKKQDSNNA